jgi:hypothetical protein
LAVTHPNSRYSQLEIAKAFRKPRMKFFGRLQDCQTKIKVIKLTKLIPRPPARVEMRKMKMSEFPSLNSAICFCLSDA